jgi:uncharacterized integral membrane protein
MSNQPGPPAQFKDEGGINSHIVIGGIVAAALLIFVLQNRSSTSIHFLMFSFSAPLWLILVIVAVLGALLDGVVMRGFRKLRGKDQKTT